MRQVHSPFSPVERGEQGAICGTLLYYWKSNVAQCAPWRQGYPGTLQVAAMILDAYEIIAPCIQGNRPLNCLWRCQAPAQHMASGVVNSIEAARFMPLRKARSEFASSARTKRSPASAPEF